MASSALPQDPEKIRETVELVVAQPDYDLALDPLVQAKSGEMLDGALNFIRRLLSPITNLSDRLWTFSPILWWVMVAVLGLVVVALLGHIVLTLRRTLQGKGAALRFGEEEAAPATPLDWEGRALLAAKNGDWLTAMRGLFTASLLTLESAANRPFRSGTTNREYLRRWRQTPMAEPLGTLVDLMDRKWYGGALCGPEDFTACEAAYRAILSRVGSARRA